MAQTRSFAQPALCPGSGFNQPDNLWYTSACPGSVPPNYIEDINTAMIDFPGAAQPKIPRGSLLASVYRGNGTAGGVSFRDMNSGFTVTIPYCPGPDYMDRPGDIILGNDPLLPLTDFRAAVAFFDLVTAMYKINYYRIHYTSAASFVVSPMGSTLFSPPGPGRWIGTTIHLDVIADYGNTALTGFPWCDEFVVTWDELLAGGASACWAHKASLSAPPGTITPALPTIPLIIPGRPAQPDVAAIQRLNPGTGAIEQIGLFAMSNGGGVAYVEYNWSSTGLSPMTLHPAPAGGTASFPRIDAPDDYNINSPTTPNLCYYKIAAQVANGTALTSQVYDNTIPGISGQDDGALVYGGLGLYNIGIYTPTVAYGGNGGQQYQVLWIAQRCLAPIRVCIWSP